MESKHKRLAERILNTAVGGGWPGNPDDACPERVRGLEVIGKTLSPDFDLVYL